MSAQAYFTVTGEALTTIARNLMLDDEPGKAYRLLADGLIGEGGEDVARHVLIGELNLIGDSISGVSVESADGQPETREYIKSLQYVYAGRVRLKGRWYRPCGVVYALGVDDARAAGPAPSRSGMEAWSRRRAEYYAPPGGLVEVVQHIDGGEMDGRYVVFELCSEPPQWMTPAVDAQAAVTATLAVGRSFEVLGVTASVRPSLMAEKMIREAEPELEPDEADALRELAYAAEDEQHAAELARITAQVREQAGEDVFALTLIDGRVVQVPRAPFMHWALARMPDDQRPELPTWTIVSPPGVKMQNDDRYHTDWILGAGLTIEEGYDQNVSRPAWAQVAEFQFAEIDHE